MAVLIIVYMNKNCCTLYILFEGNQQVTIPNIETPKWYTGIRAIVFQNPD